MDPRHLADRIHARLDEATEARTQGRSQDCIAHLRAAQDQALEAELPELFTKISWRLCKAAHDFDEPTQMLDAITPLLIAGEPFHDSPAARRALASISTKWSDTQGYSDNRIARLWQAWAEAYESDGDPWMAATGHAKSAWHWACAGRTTKLDPIIERYLAMDPRRFGTGPHRHPRAPDTPGSVWWSQLELVRTGLWHSVWAHRPERARDLLDAMEDAAEAAELDRANEVWFLDPVCRAALAFGWDEVTDRYLGSWLDALRRLGAERGDFHLALARGLNPTTPQHDRVEALAAAIEAADAGGFGPEWQIDARVQLISLHATFPQDTTSDLIAEAQALVAKYGVGAFTTHPTLAPTA